MEHDESNIQDIEEDIASFLFSMVNWLNVLQNFTSIFIQIAILILNHSFLF